MPLRSHVSQRDDTNSPDYLAKKTPEMFHSLLHEPITDWKAMRRFLFIRVGMYEPVSCHTTVSS